MPKAKLKKFIGTYAYDVPRYADFIVEAKDEAHAARKLLAAFDRGRFAHVKGEEYDNVENHRTFVSRPVDGPEDLINYPTMQQICRKPCARKS